MARLQSASAAVTLSSWNRSWQFQIARYKKIRSNYKSGNLLTVDWQLTTKAATANCPQPASISIPRRTRSVAWPTLKSCAVNMHSEPQTRSNLQRASTPNCLKVSTNLATACFDCAAATWQVFQFVSTKHYRIRWCMSKNAAAVHYPLLVNSRTPIHPTHPIYPRPNGTNHCFAPLAETDLRCSRWWDSAGWGSHELLPKAARIKKFLRLCLK